MEYVYCPICGDKLSNKTLDHSIIKHCNECDFHFYDNPKPSVLVAVLNNDKIALLNQNYIHKDYLVLVSGYVEINENFEKCSIREVKEEIGIDLKEIKYYKSIYHKSNIVMACMIGYTDQTDFTLQASEVDDCSWININEALSRMRPGSSGYKFIKEIIQKR